MYMYEKRITFSQVKRVIDRQKDPETFFQNVRAYIDKKYDEGFGYTDHTIKEIQRYADMKYIEIGGKF